MKGSAIIGAQQNYEARAKYILCTMKITLLVENMDIVTQIVLNRILMHIPRKTFKTRQIVRVATLSTMEGGENARARASEVIDYAVT